MVRNTMLKKTLVMLSLASLFAACQNYTYVFQPDRDRQGVHLRFAVQQPSKADILFVIDNSVSMKEEQSALNNSISYLLNFLAPLDTRYRLGIVSTDTIGYTTGTQGCLSGEEGLDLGDAVYGGEAKGNCTPDPARDIPLRRTHDGTGGRLIAAYDPLIFDAGNPIYDDLSSDDKTRLQSLFPTSIDDGPVGSDGLKGARWVIDREAIRVDACLACECSVDFGDTWACDMADTSCFAGDGTGCVERIAPKLVEAYFRANVNGLGVTGMGWEQGLKAALLAAGIDPDTDSNSDPFNPELSLVRAEDNAPNTIYTWDETGRMSRQSWMRDDALFGVMFVSDEEDSSMPATLWHEHVDIEEYYDLPDGGLCYIDETKNSLLSSSRMVDLVTQ
ncbi:hypothetical protein KAI87_17955, partial [Myxococcota bacterium]|nr:hypothetical protein [Myxococcota bacterium]